LGAAGCAATARAWAPWSMAAPGVAQPCIAATKAAMATMAAARLVVAFVICLRIAAPFN
jgi:hypothetical protein